MKYLSLAIFYNDNQYIIISSRHVQCVLNFADNVEEDGGTVIVPHSHKYIRRWCAENICLRRNVPFLTLNKPIIASESVDVQSDTGGVQSQSANGGDTQGITVDKTAESFEGRIKSPKKLKAMRRQKKGASDVVVDHEAPLLALAQRIPMREVRSTLQFGMLLMFVNLIEDNRHFAQSLN